MDAPKRQFLGGIKNIKPENVYLREQADYQSGIVHGLNADFLNQVFGIAGYLDVYKRSTTVEEKKEYLLKALASADRIPTYKDHFQNDSASQKPSAHAAFAEDILPYIENIDEIVVEIKRVATETGSVYESEGFSQNLENHLSTLVQSVGLISRMIKPTIGRRVDEEANAKNLYTQPLFFKMTGEQIITKEEALERIRQRLDFAAELLKKQPMEGSFSYLRKDRNVSPVDWEPNQEDHKKLEGGES